MKTRYGIAISTGLALVALLPPAALFAQVGRLQLVNISVDPMMEMVDVYLDDALWIDNFGYTQATAFTDMIAGDHQLAIAPASSGSSVDAFKIVGMTVLGGQSYHAVLAGVMDPGLYEPNPEGRDTSLKLFMASQARETSSIPGDIEARFFDGLMSEAAIDLWIKPESGPREFVVSGSYGDFSTNLTHAPGSNMGYILNAATQDTLYYADGEIENLGGQAFLELQSGFVDGQNGLPGIQWLRIFPDGTVDNLSVRFTAEEVTAEIPAAFRLLGNYPNPFNPVTNVRFDLAFSADVRVDVFDLMGRRVLQTPEQSFGTGAGQKIQLDASHLGSGVYLYRVTARSGLTTYAKGGRMVLLK